MVDQFNFHKFHLLKPDYSRPVLELKASQRERLKQKLVFLYGDEVGEKWLPELERLLKVYFATKTEHMRQWESGFKPENRFTEKDVILITYGDLIVNHGQKPLEILDELCTRYLSNVISTIHILPFFPYSSDRGFAVMDFEEVDPRLGKWEDILMLKKNFKLMFDGVINHVSSQSRWFQEFLNQNPDYTDFFTVFSTKQELSPDHLKLIVRPRTTEVITPFDTLNGTRLVWTTFSADQIDLNYKNPKVLMRVIDILLTYIRRGADIIRLDAVTYLWEELGTRCVHLQQTHEIIKMLRIILDIVAPHVALITETNVPHEDNIRYFGNGRDEAQMVYNFALPPLVLYTFQNEDASYLTQWAEKLEKVSDTATYFNFLDSHDGIGVMGVRNILSADQINSMALKVLEHGGFISYKKEGDGEVSPYEFNITWFSAMNRMDSHESIGLQAKRYLASRAIAMVIMGVPGIYLHGLLGSPNDAEAVLEERQTRSINRRTINKNELMKELEDRHSITAKIAFGMVKLLNIRKRQPAFHPNSEQAIYSLDKRLFVVRRGKLNSRDTIVSIINVSNDNLELNLKVDSFGFVEGLIRDLVTLDDYRVRKGGIKLNIKPYQVLWLKQV